MAFRIPEWKYLKYDIQELWSRLSIRKWVNTNPRIIILVTNVSVIILIVVIFGMVRSSGVMKFDNYRKDWYYDLNTGQLFAKDKDLLPPISAPSGPLPNGGPAGVKAYVFSYVKDPNNSERFIGFLEINDPNYTVIKNSSGEPRKWGEGKLIRRIEDKTWYRADSKQGREILKQALTPNKEGENPYYCPPK